MINQKTAHLTQKLTRSSLLLPGMDFNNELVRWYKTNKRDLPWRSTSDAYIIWLSEIILQQTRVEQGLPYFRRFLERYPDVTSFAAAAEDDILKLWQKTGLLFPRAQHA